MEQPAWVLSLSTHVGKESQADVRSMLPCELRRKKDGAKFSPLANDYGSTHVVPHTQTRPTKVDKLEIYIVSPVTLFFPGVPRLGQVVLDEVCMNVQS